MKTKKLYKYLRTGLKSNSGNHTWKIGEWYKEDGIDICNKGFHASKTPLQALGYVGGEILAEVSVRGTSIVQDDKECWSEMKINKAWHWTKKDSGALSIFAAELCLENFEKVYPDDKRPREAIEAARKFLGDGSEANRSAAESAARSAAESARSAAESAAWSAESAAESAAWSAAESAVWSAAESAAWSAARSAAESAARSAAESARSAAAKSSLIKKLNAWYVKKLKTLKVYE